MRNPGITADILACLEEAIQQNVLQKWMHTVVQSDTGRPMDALIFPAVASPVRRFTE